MVSPVNQWSYTNAAPCFFVTQVHFRMKAQTDLDVTYERMTPTALSDSPPAHDASTVAWFDQVGNLLNISPKSSPSPRSLKLEKPCLKPTEIVNK